MTLHIDICIEDGRWNEMAGLDALLSRALRTAAGMAAAGRNGGSVSLLLGDDARLRQLNRQFRGKGRATNVLSFPPATLAPGETLIGDIALSYDTVQREARRDGKAMRDHLTHLAVHGLLHLFGYDHENEGDARIMERMETDILARLGIADPYAPCEAIMTDTVNAN